MIKKLILLIVVMMFCGCVTNPWDSILSFLTEPPNDFKDIGDYIDDASFCKKSDEVIEVEASFDDVTTTETEEGSLSVAEDCKESLISKLPLNIDSDAPFYKKTIFWGTIGH